MLGTLTCFYIGAVIGTLFVFSEMERWQKIGYGIGVLIGLVNFLAISSWTLAAVADVVLLISCVQAWTEYFNLRSG